MDVRELLVKELSYLLDPNILNTLFPNNSIYVIPSDSEPKFQTYTKKHSSHYYLRKCYE
jgi:hypothetical protein